MNVGKSGELDGSSPLLSEKEPPAVAADRTGRYRFLRLRRSVEARLR